MQVAASARRTLESAGQSTTGRLDAVGSVHGQVIDDQGLDAVLGRIEDGLFAEFVGADEAGEVVQLGNEVGERLALGRRLLAALSRDREAERIRLVYVRLAVHVDRQPGGRGVGDVGGLLVVDLLEEACLVGSGEDRPGCPSSVIDWTCTAGSSGPG